MDKFLFGIELSQETKEEVSNFDREQKTFKEFSKKARDIRNNRFADKPELLADFDNFQATLKDKLVRPLYPLQFMILW
jgi:hypothetical protein